MVRFDFRMDLVGCLLFVAAIEAILGFVSVEHFACWCIRTAALTVALSGMHLGITLFCLLLISHTCVFH